MLTRFLNGISFWKSRKGTKKFLTSFLALYEQNGVDYLLDMLAEFDSESAENLKEQRNVKRIIRAIEFYKTSGITISEHNRNSKLQGSPYNPIKKSVLNLRTGKKTLRQNQSKS